MFRRESRLDRYGYSIWTREIGIFNKVYLDITHPLSTDTNLHSIDNLLFGKEWDNVRKQQLFFLLERPLMFKVLTEKRSGPARLNALFVGEFSEAEEEFAKFNNFQNKLGIYELADMSLLVLTHDSLNPELSLLGQITVLKNNWSTVVSFCRDLKIDKNDLVLPVERKIKINKLRNPIEAFMLMENEPMTMSIDRMQHNWEVLKEKRNRHFNSVNKIGWWKKWLIVDKNGWVRERIT